MMECCVCQRFLGVQNGKFRFSGALKGGYSLIFSEF